MKKLARTLCLSSICLCLLASCSDTPVTPILTTWSDADISKMESVLGDGYTLPFYYLGDDYSVEVKGQTDRPDCIVYSINQTTKTDQDNYYSEIVKEGWTLDTSSSENKTYYFDKYLTTDDYDYVITLLTYGADSNPSDSGLLTVTGQMFRTYNNWSNDEQSKIKEALDGNLIPFSYPFTSPYFNSYSITYGDGTFLLKANYKTAWSTCVGGYDATLRNNGYTLNDESSVKDVGKFVYDKAINDTTNLEVSVCCLYGGSCVMTEGFLKVEAKIVTK